MIYIEIRGENNDFRTVFHEEKKRSSIALNSDFFQSVGFPKNFMEYIFPNNSNLEIRFENNTIVFSSRASHGILKNHSMLAGRSISFLSRGGMIRGLKLGDSIKITFEYLK
ncbi:MAG: hypothetical protein IPN70_04965 [Candidatus Moraniibacteriota bacterium]|nr:MAG: hypothetical protein IPN70_04965 [Candidatus Moranbacteria bacterium]